MSITMGSLHYAHDEGHTDVCYADDGSKYITCGADGDVRIWSIETPDDPVNKCIGESAACIRKCHENLYVATGNNDIQVMTYPEGERNLVLERFVAPINHIAIHNETKHIALAGEDMEVKLIDLNDNKKEVFSGPKAPCLSVALSADLKFVAASSGDGILRVWEIATKDLVAEIPDCFRKVNSFKNTKSLCRIDFDTKGKYLAYPKKNTVVLLNCTDWSEFSTLESSQVKTDISIVQFSPCGDYLIATSLDGDFLLFKVASKVVVKSAKHIYSKVVTGLMWNPLGNGEIVYTDIDGQLGILEECNSVGGSNVDVEPESTDNEVDFGDVQFEDDDEDDENVVSVEKLKKQAMGEDEPELNFDAASSRSPTPRARTPEIPLQEPFMPTSSPEHLNPRYLCWNEVAIVRCYKATDTSSDSIEIEFNDSTFHNNMMIPNFNDYTMGTISKSAVAVANSNLICVIPLSASTKEWTLKLEDNEEIVLIGVSDKFVCFGTSRYKIRVFSVWGDSSGVFFMPGPLVSMAAFSNCLVVAYHSGGVRKNDQSIGIKLIRFHNYAMNCEEIGAALNPESTISWLGFTDLGTPAMMDSAGTLSLYTDTLWIPFCDTKTHCKNPGDGFFVTCVPESSQTVVGIKCKGAIYPGFTPRPTVCELDLETPFCKPANEQEKMERDLFSWSQLKSKDQQTYNKTALKAFALACKNNFDERAFSLMEKSSNTQLVDLATKYAMKMNKKHLVDKLRDLYSRIGEEEEEEIPSLPPPVVVHEPEPEIIIPKPKVALSKRLNSSKTRKTPRNADSLIMDGIDQINNKSLAETTMNISKEVREPTPEPAKPVNPFLKSLRKQDENKAVNPLSLIDKRAGIEFEEEKPKKDTKEIKRKKPESDVEKPTRGNKQRKLDKFMFTKAS